MALDILRKRLDGNHYWRTNILLHLGNLLRQNGELDEAEELLREALAKRSFLGSPPGRFHIGLGRCLVAKDQFEEAEEELLAAYRDLQSTTHGRGPGLPNPALIPLADLYRAWGRPDQAAAYLEEAERSLRPAVENARARGEPYRTSVNLCALGACLTRMNRYEEAETALLEAYRLMATPYGENYPELPITIEPLVALYEAWGKPAEAAAWQARLDEFVARSATEP